MKCCLGIICLLLASSGFAQERTAAVSFVCDQRVEFLTALARTAGFSEYAQKGSPSAYQRAVDEWLQPHRAHEAVQLLQAMRREHGTSYDAIPSLALHLTGAPGFAELAPFDDAPERLDARWKPAPTRRFLVALRTLWKEADGTRFFATQESVLAAAGKSLAMRLANCNGTTWLAGYGVGGAKVPCRVIAGLLCGTMNYGCGVRIKGFEELNPVLGCESFDADGTPQFSGTAVPLFVHELAHSFANPLVDECWTSLESAAAKFFAESEPAMRAQAYATPRVTMYETMVRLIVLRWLGENDPRGAAAQLAQDAERGFTWLRECVGVLDDYERGRATWPTLKDFMPRLSAVLAKEADRLTVLSAAAPKLVRTIPAGGASDVDPAIDTLTIEFDRPMQAGSYSIVGSRTDTPGINGAPLHSEDGRTFKFPIRLAPGHQYSFGLNSPKSLGFRSTDGAPLKPITIRFKTRG